MVVCRLCVVCCVLCRRFEYTQNGRDREIERQRDREGKRDKHGDRGREMTKQWTQRRSAVSRGAESRGDTGKTAVAARCGGRGGGWGVLMISHAVVT